MRTEQILTHAGLALTLVASSAAASETPEVEGAKFIVDYAATDPDDAWIAAAFEQYAIAELSSFERLSPVYKSGAEKDVCSDRKPWCLTVAFEKQGADIVIIGTLDNHTLSYTVRETWTGSQVAHGNISVESGERLLRIRNQMLLAVNPFLTSGGLLEQRGLFPTERIEGSLGFKSRIPAAILPVVFVLIGLLLTPYLLLLALTGARGLGTILRGRSFRLTLVLIAALLAIGFAPRFLENLALPDVWLRFRGPSAALAGGLAWGGLALLFLRVAFTPLHGIEHVRGANLGPLLKAWSYVVSLRLLLTLVLAAPVIVAVFIIGQTFELEAPVVLMGVAPTVSLTVLLWALNVVEVLSTYLDLTLVDGAASEANPLYKKIQRYFRSYALRSDVDIDAQATENTLFLPGHGDGISTYGGGLTRPRVVVGAKLIEATFGGSPQAQEEGTGLDFDEWMTGWLPGGTPVQSGAVRSVVNRPIFESGAGKLTGVGLNETLLGYALPASPKESDPQTDPTPRKLEVPAHKAHYAALDMKVSGDHDDDLTDSTHRDFLYGALLRATGVILRWDSVLGTIVVALSTWLSKRPVVFQRPANLIRGVYLRYAGRYPAIVADSYPALNLGRDHLIQYLWNEWTGDASMLTARASQPELQATSGTILLRTQQTKPTAQEEGTHNATIRNRLTWLSHYTFFPIREPRRHTFRIAIATVIVLACGYGVFTSVRESMNYGPIYTQRMEELQQQLDNADEQGVK